MHLLKESVPYYRKKIFILFTLLTAVLITIRILLPSLLLKNLNTFLGKVSPDYRIHLTDLDLGILRGAYRLEGVEGFLIKDGKKFLYIDTIDVSMAFRELLKGKVMMDIIASGIDFHYSNALKEIGLKSSKGPAQTASKKVFPVKISRLDLKESKITVDDYPGLEPEKKLEASSIESRITNLTPSKNAPLSFFTLKATLLGSAVLKTAGKLNLTAKPPAWDFDSEVQDFDLTTLNAYLVRKVPLTFTRGKLDLYAEAVSQEGKIEGYVKPFIKNLDVIKKKENFKGPKHWAFEILTAVANVILRASDAKTVATKIPFSYDHTFKVDTEEASSKAIEHGFKQQLSPGIENKLELK